MASASPLDAIETEVTRIDDKARLEYHLRRVSATIEDLTPLRERHGRHIALAITALEDAEHRIGKALKALEG